MTKWEPLSKDGLTTRVKVFGGWLVYHVHTVKIQKGYFPKDNIVLQPGTVRPQIVEEIIPTGGMTFVPDPNHEWELKEKVETGKETT